MFALTRQHRYLPRAVAPLLLGVSLYLAVGGVSFSAESEDALSDFDKANRLMVLENYESARELYQKVIDNPMLASLHDHALFLQAKCLHADGDWSQAEYYLQQLFVTYPGSQLLDDAFYLMGNHFASEMPERDPVKAMQFYRTVISRFPEGDKADPSRFRLGELSVETGQWDEAIEILNTLHKRKTSEKLQFESGFALAEAYRDPKNPKRDPAKALGIFKDMLERFPQRSESARMHFALAVCYRDLKQYDEAIRALNVVLEKYPDSLFASVATPLLNKCVEERQKIRVETFFNQLRDQAPRATPADSEASRGLLDLLRESAKKATSIEDGTAPNPDNRRLRITADQSIDGHTWRGNVHLINADVSIKAQEIIYKQAENTVLATGAVLVQRQGMTVECQKVTYLLPLGIIEAEGEVVVKDKGTISSSGQRIRVSLNQLQVLP